MGSNKRLGGGKDLGLGGRQRRLAGKQILGETGDVGPEGAGEGEVGAEVEQGFLLDLPVAANRADQAAALAGLTADQMGLGGPNEHEDWVATGKRPKQALRALLRTTSTFRIPKRTTQKQNTNPMQLL